MTTTDQTLADARAKLARLETDHAAAEAAKAERVRTALRDLAERRHAPGTGPAADARNAAEAAWQVTADDPAATLDQLWGAFVAVKIASAVHTDTARNDAANADRRLGMTVNDIGVQIPRPRPAIDPWAGVTFDQALAPVVTKRAQAAVQAAATARHAEEAAVIAKAEKG